MPFKVRIPDDEQDPDLAKKIIASEMSGVLNYVIEGAKSLLANGKFDIPAAARDAVKDFRMESDTVLTFMEESGYCPSSDEWITFAELYESYREAYPDGMKRHAFSRQLRKLGYEVKKQGKKNTVVVYAMCQETDDAK